MSGEHSKPAPTVGDDIFDLPTEAGAAKGAARTATPSAASALDASAPPLPKRPQGAPAGGAPLASASVSSGTAPGSNAQALLDQVRRRSAPPAEAAVLPAEEPAVRRVVLPRGVWIALGALALLNVLALGHLVLRPSGPATDARTDHASESAPSVTDPNPEGSTGAEHSAAQPRAHPTQAVAAVPALEIAQQALREARADLDAGRRSAARARLGRIGLAIDAIDADKRDEIRAEVGLLLARSIQDDADQAARSKR